MTESREAGEIEWVVIDVARLMILGNSLAIKCLVTRTATPFLPLTMPRHDDETLGFSFFRELIEDADYSNLTLPRTFFGRSGFEQDRFNNTDLSGSRMCWNEFKDCDFSGADLTGCDMRATAFENCKFVGAILRGADLRRSSFNDCDFRARIWWALSLTRKKLLNT